MDDLVAWLLEQIAEDERVARLASGPTWYLETYLNLGATPAAVWSALPPRDENLVAAHGPNPHNLRHLATWDPARVLAECEPRREIVNLYLMTATNDLGPLMPGWETQMALADQMLRLLGSFYAHRPGYREEWRP